MYWLGLQPGDVHLNLSSPGWAKHAWSSFFAPWNAQATILAYQYERFDARALLEQLVRCRVTSFCAPPTVWRMLIQSDLRTWRVSLRELASAGEPLNPEVIAQVRDAWGITIRDGFGQTETTAQVGNPPGQPVKPGSMGRPLPGCPIVLLGTDGRVSEEGEICIDLAQRPLGLMQGYLDDGARNASAMGDGYYHTGDVASRDTSPSAGSNSQCCPRPSPGRSAASNCANSRRRAARIPRDARRSSGRRICVNRRALRAPRAAPRARSARHRGRWCGD